MTPPSDRALLAALADLSAALEELETPAMIIGGLAVVVRGVPRQTVDIDATVWAEGLSLESLAATLGRHHIVGRIPDALEFAKSRHVLLSRHVPTRTPLDVSLAWLPFEQEALEGRPSRTWVVSQ